MREEGEAERKYSLLTVLVDTKYQRLREGTRCFQLGNSRELCIEGITQNRTKEKREIRNA